MVKVIGEVADPAHEPAGTGYGTVAIVGVKAGCIVADGIHDDEAGGDDIGGVDDPARGIGEQGATEALTVEIAVQGEPGDEHGGDALWRASPNLVGKIPAFDDVAGQGEVGEDRAGSRPYPGASGANGLGVVGGAP